MHRACAFPGELLADAIPLQVITTLAVIEQTDDRDYIDKEALAFDEVLSQYGLKQDEAYRYSVSSARALGPMQFTNRKGKGTYSAVVRRCPEARLDPVFETGATNLLNAMKAAICLLDMEIAADAVGHSRGVQEESCRAGNLSRWPPTTADRETSTKLYRVLKRMKVQLHRAQPPAGGAHWFSR